MTTSFKSMTLIGAALASALGCYLVSLEVSSERAAVERARGRIASDLADIRLLQAELRTRARLPELQRWNEQVLALAPPKAEQFLASPVMLASYAVAPAPAVRMAVAPAPVRLAVAPAPAVPAAPVRQVAYRAPEPRARPEFGLAALAGSIDAAAAAERSGFQKIALR